MVQIHCSKAAAVAHGRELLTVGMSRAVEVGFDFSPEWAGLSKTAVFTDGVVTVDVLESEWTDGVATHIPHEVLTTAGRRVRVGIYGTDGERVVLPTVWAELGTVLPGAEPSGDESTDAALPVWAQLQKQIDEIEVSPEDVEAAVESYLAENPPAAPQADWSVNDESAPAYVKNRTHWTEREETEVLNADGVRAEDGTEYVWEVRGVNLPAELEGECRLYVDDVLVSSSGYYWQEMSWGGFAFSGTGWDANLSGVDSFTFYDNSKTYTGDTPHFRITLAPIIHKLDEKYLPDDNTRTLTVRFSRDDSGNYTADKTFEEIEEAAQKGYHVVGIDGGAVMPLVEFHNDANGSYAQFGAVPYLEHAYESPSANISQSSGAFVNPSAVFFNEPESFPLAAPMVVTVTESSDGAVTCDTPYEKISAALDAGNCVTCKLESAKRESRLYAFSTRGDGYICFAGATEFSDDDGDGKAESVFSPGGVFIYNNDTLYIDAEDEVQFSEFARAEAVQAAQTTANEAKTAAAAAQTTANEAKTAAASAAQKSDIPTKLPAPNALTLTGAVEATYDGSEPVTVEIPEGGGDSSLGITGAQVGQTVKITAVDEDGKPTAWEAADGFNGFAFRRIRKVVIPEDITTGESGVAFCEMENGGALFSFDTDENGEPFDVTELFMCGQVGSEGANSYMTLIPEMRAPAYGWGAGWGTHLYVPGNGSLSYQSAWCQLISDGGNETMIISTGVGFNGGGANNVLCNGRVLWDTYSVGGRAPLSIRAISAYIGNVTTYGFLPGSYIEFYGR